MNVDGIYGHHNVRASLSPDGKTLAFVEFKRHIILYDMASGQQDTLSTEDLGVVQNFTYSADGEWFFCQGLYGKDHPRWMARIDSRTGESEILWQSDDSMITYPCPSPDGKYVASRRTYMGLGLFKLEGF